MKQSKRKSFFGAVNLTASVLALGLLIGLFTGCPPGVKPPETPETVTITLTGDENVTVNAPNTLEVTKGSKWSGVRSKVEEKVSYKPGYEAKGFKLGSAIGADLQDNYIFNENKTVFVLSKPKGGSIQPSSITITVDADEGYTLVSPSNFEVTSGAKWDDIKAQAQAKVSLKAGYTALEWKLGGASGAYLDGNHTFNKSTTVSAVSKQNGDPKPETVGITVLGDEGVELAVENTFKADKNAEWQNIKAAATGKITVKENCELKEWRLTDKTGQIIEDNNTFTEDTTVFAVTRPKSSPIPQIANYTVEHWQQNIADNEYTKIEADTETKTGNAGENTAAAAKTYVGFTEKPIIQKKIEADGSTVVKIEYDRNIITLMLNLDGGTTTTQLTDGNKLKGRFGSPVTVAEPVKEGEIFGGWEPDLPDTFPAQNHSEVYTAQWGDSFIIKISGDERTQIPKNTYIKPEGANTWSEIRDRAKEKVMLKSEWKGGDYAVYEWRLKNEAGEKLTDEYPINKSITVYAVTNYVNFNIDSTGTRIILTSEGKGYKGTKPKGKIILGDGIIEIESGGNWNGAFIDCTEITSVSLPQSLISIGNSTFSGCTGLTSLDLPANLVSIGNGAFSRCTGLTSVDLSGFSSLTSIAGAFSDCTGLTSVDLSGCSSLTSIAGAFSDCTGLTSVDFSGCTSLTEIGEKFFYQHTNLQSIKFSGCTSLASIGNNAFSDCTGLTSMDLSGCTSFASIGDHAFYNCTGLTSLDLSSLTRLTSIGDGAFRYCKGLKSVGLPANLVTLKYWAFSRCTGLTSVDLSGCSNLTSIAGAFSDCTGLTSVDLSGCSSLTSIAGAFSGCIGLTSVDLSGCSNLTEIGGAFASCYSLTSLDLSACINLTAINPRAFYWCMELISVTLPASPLTVIGENAFCECTKLASLDLSGYTGFTTIGNGAFYKCKGLTNLNLPIGITAIGSEAFSGCTGLASLDLSGYTNLTTIGSEAFSGCIGLTSLDLSGYTNLTTIDNGTFSGCTGLTSVDLSGCSNLSSIGKGAFDSCTKATVSLPIDVQAIGDFAFGSDYDSCEKVIVPNYEIYRKVLDTYYAKNRIEFPGRFEEGGFYYSDSTKTILIGCTNVVSGNITIPSTVTTIGRSAFISNYSITGVNLSSCTNLTVIDKNAFTDCKYLPDISLPSNITSIKQGAFAYSGLTSIDLSGLASLTVIDKAVFYGCRDLVNISLPANLTMIDEYAFSGCTKAEIKLPISVQTIGNDAFGLYEDSYCKKVLIKSGDNFERIKVLVTGNPCNYPADRVESYN